MAYLNDPENFERSNDPDKTAIYLMALDKSIDFETLTQFKEYIQAVFHGVRVRVMQSGIEFHDVSPPADFVGEHGIETRGGD